MYPKKFKSYIKQAIALLKELFLLHEWQITVLFNASNSKEENLCADIVVEQRYLRAQITIYPRLYQAYQDGSSEVVKDVIIHEFCHIFTEPLSNALSDSFQTHPANFEMLITIAEQQTQRIANAIINMDNKEINKIFTIREKKKLKRKK